VTQRQVELLAIGAGPSNLALAVALEELAPDDLARDSLLIERAETVQWQRGLLLPWTKSQVSSLKDLVTRRNPRSRFSFLNYLHDVGRLDDFINMGSFTPYRIEISDYLNWVAGSLAKVRLELGRECLAVEPRRDASGALTGWITRLGDGSEIASRYLVTGSGRDPYIPPVFHGVPAGRLIHSTQYVSRAASLARDVPYRVAVIGGAQSAAEMFRAIQDDLPNSDITWITRSVGPSAYETGKFNNELYYPSFVDEFFEARPEGREQILREMHRTNYSGVAPALLESLYGDFYLDRIAGHDRRRMITMADVTCAREEGAEAVLELTDRRTGAVSRLPSDLIFLGTGHVKQMPGMVRQLGTRLGLADIKVSRGYRLALDEPATAACYVQGLNEETHGIADSLLSVLAVRAADTIADLLAHRSAGVQLNGHRRPGGSAFGAVRVPVGAPASSPARHPGDNR
jgi:L-ornithine N5-oxygenase